MPIVTIRVTRKGTKPGAPSVTVEETAALIKGTVSFYLQMGADGPRDEE